MNTPGKIIRDTVRAGIQVAILKAHRINHLKFASEKSGFTPGEYAGLSGVPIIENVRLKSVDGSLGLLLTDAICVVNQTKNIIKTPLQGRNGTVKEYVSEGDFQVNISGTITSPTPEVYPESDVATLISMCRLSEAIEVTSEFLQAMGIFKLVVDYYSLPQESGWMNRQKYELRCLSDLPIELLIDE